MPRQPRVHVLGVSAHVYLRSINGIEIFHADDDYRHLYELVADAAVINGVDVNAFALMSTHYHLIVTAPSVSSLADAMKNINGGYVRYYNRKHNRFGTLWSGRFNAKPLTDQRYFWHCFTYVERNPVDANIVDTAEDYSWSSYTVHALGAHREGLVLHPLYLALGSTPARRQAAYRAIFHRREALWPGLDGV